MNESNPTGFLAKITKRKKLLLGTMFVILTGPIGWLKIDGGQSTIRLVDSHIGNLILFIVLLTSIVKVALRNPQGWLWGAAFFYYSAFAHYGLPAWLYMLVALGGLITYLRWTNPNK
jgi:hypothetical protein